MKKVLLLRKVIRFAMLGLLSLSCASTVQASSFSLGTDFSVDFTQTPDEDDSGLYCRANTPEIGIMGGWGPTQFNISRQPEYGREEWRHTYSCRKGTYNEEDYYDSSNRYREFLRITVRDIYEVKDGTRTLIATLVEVYHFGDGRHGQPYNMDGDDVDVDFNDFQREYEIDAELVDGTTVKLTIPESNFHRAR